MEKDGELLRRSVEAYRDQTNLGITIAALLLGIVGVLLPILTYLTSILPATRATSEARQVLDGLEHRFAELSAKHQKEEVERAIERLHSQDASLRAGAAAYLAVNTHFLFTARQIAEICHVAEYAEQSLRQQLFAVLSGRDSPDVTRLLQRSLTGPHGVHYLHHAMKQMALPTGAGLRVALQDWLLSKDGRAYLPAAFTTAASLSDDLLRDVINDSKFLDQFSVMERANALTVLRTGAVARDVSDIVRGSALARSLAGRVLHFMNPSTGSPDACSPANASVAFVYEDGVQKGVLTSSSQEFREAVESASRVTA